MNSRLLQALALMAVFIAVSLYLQTDAGMDRFNDLTTSIGDWFADTFGPND
jgi:hypothetical protein